MGEGDLLFRGVEGEDHAGHFLAELELGAWVRQDGVCKVQRRTKSRDPRADFHDHAKLLQLLNHSLSEKIREISRNWEGQKRNKTLTVTT